MNRTIFTTEDVKNIVEQIFNGNLRQSRLSRGMVEYENPNSEKILLIDSDSGEQTEKDLAEYLNIDFYAWKQRLVEKSSRDAEEGYETFDDWVLSLNFSMNEAYALVETTDEDTVASQDIDSATKMGKITFIVQSDKIKNLDYYVAKIRNSFLGNPQHIQNSYGDNIVSYILMGTLMYDQEPIMTQIGECIIVSLNFRISYMSEALTYNDTKIEISLDGDDMYDARGNIVDASGKPTDTKYLQMPITKATWQLIFASTAVPTAKRPDLTGFVATSISNVKTFSFFDFNKELTMKFNDLFWRLSAHRINGVLSEKNSVNVPVYIRITSNGNSYVFKDMIDNMEKVLSNSDFNISSITLKGWGKTEKEL